MPHEGPGNMVVEGQGPDGETPCPPWVAVPGAQQVGGSPSDQAAEPCSKRLRLAPLHAKRTHVILPSCPSLRETHCPPNAPNSPKGQGWGLGANTRCQAAPPHMVLRDLAAWKGSEEGVEQGEVVTKG